MWPELKVAEHENIERIKQTARSTGRHCIAFDDSGECVDDEYANSRIEDMDFVLHLHFSTPKTYDNYSFVTLWNPPDFHMEFGYRKCLNNILSHDDFLTCGSSATTDQVLRVLYDRPSRLKPELPFYTSLSAPVIRPESKQRKLFYIGINWERLGGRHKRHSGLLKLLDRKEVINIYGPEVFNGIEVWKGFNHYKGELPFDGSSVVEKIAECGIGLVLSSEAHFKAGVVSNRVFECAAAGVVIISDRNPFVVHNFGDSVLYIDQERDNTNITDQIVQHISWVNEHPDESTNMASRSQEIFLNKFNLESCLNGIYQNLEKRKKNSLALYSPVSTSRRIDVGFINPNNDQNFLKWHIESLACQKYPNLHPVLIFGKTLNEECRETIDTLCGRFGFTVPEIRILEDAINEKRLGRTIHSFLQLKVNTDLFSIVGPGEKLFSDHFHSLVRSLEDCVKPGTEESIICACSDAVFDIDGETEEKYILVRNANFKEGMKYGRAEMGRFLFDIKGANEFEISQIKHFGAGVMQYLLSRSEVCFSKRTTMRSFTHSTWDSGSSIDFELIDDFKNTRKALQFDEFQRLYEELEPRHLSFNRLSEKNQTELAVKLAHSIPLPGILKRILFGGYRKWLNRDPQKK